MNPPYGERLDDEKGFQLIDQYRQTPQRPDTVFFVDDGAFDKKFFRLDVVTFFALPLFFTTLEEEEEKLFEVLPSSWRFFFPFAFEDDNGVFIFVVLFDTFFFESFP